MKTTQLHVSMQETHTFMSENTYKLLIEGNLTF